MKNGWLGKKILVTGANSGIGLAIVETALREGASVSALYHNAHDNLDKLPKENLHLFKGDVSKISQVENWGKEIIALWGTFDIVINNAGAMYYMSMLKPSLKEMMTMVETNCIGFLNLVSAILPSLIDKNAGHWINITSDAGKKPFPGLAIYSGSKAFVEFSASAMRQELILSNIKVTNIQPGNVATYLHNKSTDIAAQSQYASEDEGQYLQVSDIVDAIAYAIASPKGVAVNEILVEPLSESI